MDTLHGTRDLDALSFAEATETIGRVGPGLLLGPLLMAGSIWRGGRQEPAVAWAAITILLTAMGLVTARLGRARPTRPAWRQTFALAAFVVGACWGASVVLLDPSTPGGAISRVIPPIAVIAMVSVIFVPHRASFVAGVAGVSIPYLASFTQVDRVVTIESLPGFLTVSTLFVIHGLGETRRRRAAIVARLAAADHAEEMRRDRAHALATNAHLRAVNEHVRHLAEHDALTGAYNRRVLLERLGRVPTDVRPEHSLVLLDLDHFKDANDRYGHAMGDEILCHLTQAAHQLLGDAACFTRWGGEEFAFLHDQHAHGDVAVVLDRLRAALQTRLPAGVRTGFSAGAARWEPGLLTTDLLRRADTALYAAKANGRGRTELFSAIMPTPPRDVSTTG